MNDESGRPRGHRRSVRLPDFDYTRAGAYFITVCTKDRLCVFGTVQDGQMQLSPVGEVTEYELWFTEWLRKNVKLGAHCIMPNHIHAIIWLGCDDEGTARRAPTAEAFAAPVKNSLPTIVRSFKAAVTKDANYLCGRSGKGFWQRGYYEHVIRSERELAELRKYISENPLKWELDAENPANS